MLDQVAKAILKECPSVGPYSGRGMYGRWCAALRVGDVTESLRELFEAGRQAAPLHESYRALEQLVSDFATDALGRGMVMYWPDIPWEEDV